MDESNDVSQQQHMVLSFLLRLLDSLAHCPLEEFKEMATTIMDLILKLGVSVQFLFENKAESWEKRQKQEEEEEEGLRLVVNKSFIYMCRTRGRSRE